MRKTLHWTLWNTEHNLPAYSTVPGWCCVTVNEKVCFSQQGSWDAIVDLPKEEEIRVGLNNWTTVIPAMSINLLLVITVAFVGFEGGKPYKYNPKLFMLSLLRLTEVYLKFIIQEGGCGSLVFFIIASERYTHLKDKSDLRWYWASLWSNLCLFCLWRKA